ncbi:MAG TPA: Hpt domain-containing protein [Thermoanaerobaculia bacterium]|jgi:HPt (histidine-containing phosphotransfer) domain-containing protein
MPHDRKESSVVSTLAGHPTLGSLVRAFVDRLPSRREAIEEAFRDGDLERLQVLAHGLRGSGGTYGFEPLSRAAEELEESLRAGAGRDEVAAAVARLADLCRRAVVS